MVACAIMIVYVITLVMTKSLLIDDLYTLTEYNNELAWIIMSTKNTGSFFIILTNNQGSIAARQPPVSLKESTLSHLKILVESNMAIPLFKHIFKFKA